MAFKEDEQNTESLFLTLKWCYHDAIIAGTFGISICLSICLQDHPEVVAWVALDDLDFDWADALRQAGPILVSAGRSLDHFTFV